jgi:Uma2 family endonuclease
MRKSVDELEAFFKRCDQHEQGREPDWDSHLDAIQRGTENFAMSTTAKDLVQKHRLTVGDYHRMGEVGIFHEDSRVELIEGEINEMPPIGSTHAGTVGYLDRVLNRAIGEHAMVWPQNPIILDDHSEPQPDFVLLRPRGDFYMDSHPRPEDVLLIVEVSDSTLRYDHRIKIPLYARFGIPEVWLIDVEHKKLNLFRSPSKGAYRSIVEAAPLVVTPQRLPDVTVDLARLF